MMSRAFNLLVVTCLGVGGSLANFMAQAVLAYRFGAGHDVDAYVFSLSLPSFIAGSLAICVSYIVVPEIAKLADKPEQELALSSSFLAVVMAVAVVLALISVPAIILQPAVLLPPRSVTAHHQDLELLIAIAWATGGVQLVNSLLISRLNAVSRPIAAAMLSLPPGVVTTAVLLAVPNSAIWVAAVGLLLGTLAVMLIGLSLQRGRFVLKLQLLPSASKGPKVQRSVWLSVIALTCFSSYAVIDSFWAPRIGQGALSALGYGQRILISTGNFVILGSSAVAVPVLARIAAARDVAGFRRTATKFIAGVAAAAACVALLISSLAGFIVALLFQRGAFDAEAATQVASVISHLAPGTAAMLAGSMLMRALFCIPRSHGWAAVIGLGWSAGYFVLSALFVDRQVTGLADAYSLTWGMTAVAGSLILWHRAGTLGDAGKPSNA